MTDPRHQKLAQVLINYSLGIQPGDKLIITAPAAAAPLVKEAYREAIRAGAHVMTRITIDGLAEIRFRESTDEQLRFVLEPERQEIEYFDAMLRIMADENTKSLTNVDPNKLAIAQQARTDIMRRYLERAATGELRWCLTLYPTHAYAQDAEMSLEEYENFVFSAGLIHHDNPSESWQQISKKQQEIVKLLESHDEIHIVGNDIDLRYRVGGRKWISADGKHNFPDGEVFTGPIEDSVNGHIRFSYPAVYNGREVENVRLTFQDGKVVEATASRGEDLLNSMLNVDEGARRVGEVAFGLNYDIQKFTRNILFDEKIGGTMHMALGRAYPETGGTNASAIHWDMIADLTDAKVYADGELIYENRKFKIW